MSDPTPTEKRAALVRFVKTVAGLFGAAVSVLYILKGGKR